MPIINLKPTDLKRAFFLNAFASALILIIALYIKGRYDTYRNIKGENVQRETNFKSLGLTFLFTFIGAFGGYVLMYYTFGYSGSSKIR